jgi:hypothetical protein
MSKRSIRHSRALWLILIGADVAGMADAQPPDPYLPPPKAPSGSGMSTVSRVVLIAAACVAAVVGLVVVALVLGVFAFQMKVANK